MKDRFLRDIQAKNRSKRTNAILECALNDCETDIKKPLHQAEWPDIITHIENLQKNYSPSTVALTKSKLKQFYSYCYEETDDNKYRKMAKKLSGKIEADTKLLPQDILIESDILKMINICKWERDRCVLMVLWEGGLRIGELLNLTNSMVEIIHDREEVIFHIPDKPGSKTGHRSVLCKKVYFYVVDYMKCNPSDRFIDMSVKGLNSRLQTLADIATIKKPVNPHAFRHGAITNAVIQKMPEIDIKMRFWGNINSAMLNTYVHLSQQMTQDAYRTFMNGDSSKDDTESKVCLVCGRPVINGELCEPCTKQKKLSEENETLKAQMEATQKGYEEMKKQMEFIQKALAAKQ